MSTKRLPKLLIVSMALMLFVGIGIGGFDLTTAFAAEETGTEQTTSAEDAAKQADGGQDQSKDNKDQGQAPTKASDKAGKDAKSTTKATTKSNQSQDTDAKAEGTAEATKASAAEKNTDTDKTAAKSTIKQRELKAKLIPQPLYQDTNATSGKKQKTAELKRLTSLWESLMARKLPATEEALKLEVTVSGKLPEGLTAEARYIALEDSSAHTEQGIASLDVTLLDKSGKRYIPENPVTIAIKGDVLKTQISAAHPLIVYSYAANQARANEYTEKYAKDGARIYAADVTVAKSSKAADKLLHYETYDPDKTYKNGADAVRYTEAKDGLKTGNDTVRFAYDFAAAADAAKKAAADGKPSASAADAHLLLTAQMSTRTLHAKAGDARITVTGVLDPDVTLKVREVGEKDKNYDTYVAKTAAALDAKATELDFVRAFDIKLVDPETGKEFEPDSDMKVSIQLGEEDLDENADFDVAHFANGVNKAPELMDAKTSGDTVKFTAEGFSVYVVTYTVDFHWGDYTYSIAGEDSILLSELFKELGVEEITGADVKNVTFSDPKLVKVTKTGLLGAGDDWKLTSLKAFDTNETLTLELKNGEKVEIGVTDAQPIKCTVFLTDEYNQNQKPNKNKPFGEFEYTPADGVESIRIEEMVNAARSQLNISDSSYDYCIAYTGDNILNEIEKNEYASTDDWRASWGEWSGKVPWGYTSINNGIELFFIKKPEPVYITLINHSGYGISYNTIQLNGKNLNETDSYYKDSNGEWVKVSNHDQAIPKNDNDVVELKINNGKNLAYFFSLKFTGFTDHETTKVQITQSDSDKSFTVDNSQGKEWGNLWTFYLRGVLNSDNTTITFGDSATPPVTNMNITLNQSWKVEETGSTDPPTGASVAYELHQVKKNKDGSWTDKGTYLVEDGLTLPSEDKWSKTISDLPTKDDDGNDLGYYIVETQNNATDYSVVTYKDGNGNEVSIANPMTSSGTIFVTNTKPSTNIHLTISQAWLDQTTDNDSAAPSGAQARFCVHQMKKTADGKWKEVGIYNVNGAESFTLYGDTSTTIAVPKASPEGDEEYGYYIEQTSYKPAAYSLVVKERSGSEESPITSNEPWVKFTNKKTKQFVVTKEWLDSNGNKIDDNDDRIKGKVIQFDLYEVTNPTSGITTGTNVNLPDELMLPESQTPELWKDDKWNSTDPEVLNPSVGTIKPEDTNYKFFQIKGQSGWYYVTTSIKGRNYWNVDELFSGNAQEFIKFSGRIFDDTYYQHPDNGTTLGQIELKKPIDGSVDFKMGDIVIYDKYLWIVATTTHRPNTPNKPYTLHEINNGAMYCIGAAPSNSGNSGKTLTIDYENQTEAVAELDTLTNEENNFAARKYNEDGKPYTLSGKNSYDGKSWSRTINGLDPSCTYYAVETAIDGKSLEDDADVKYLYSQDEQTLTIQNTCDEEVGSHKVILRKVAKGSYTPLSGAAFEIHKDSKEGDQVSQKNSAGTTITTFTSNESGVYFVGELNEGTYWIQEVQAPSGYGSNDKAWFKIEVKSTGVEQREVEKESST